MKIFAYAVAIVMLAACQQDNASNEPNEPKTKTATEAPAKSDSPAKEPVAEAATETAETKTESKDATHDHSHDHGHSHDAPASTGELFAEVEPQATCEEPVVIEFFAYQCPHCFKLEPYAVKWQESKNAVKFISIPSDLGRKEYQPFLFTHFAATKLGVIKKAKEIMFNRLHNDKKIIQSIDEAIDILVEAGATRMEATTALNDEAFIRKSFEENYKLMAGYKVTGVPSIIVNHSYKTDITMARGSEKVFEVVNDLLSKPSACSK